MAPKSTEFDERTQIDHAVKGHSRTPN